MGLVSRCIRLSLEGLGFRTWSLYLPKRKATRDTCTSILMAGTWPDPKEWSPGLSRLQATKLFPVEVSESSASFARSDLQARGKLAGLYKSFQRRAQSCNFWGRSVVSQHEVILFPG